VAVAAAVTERASSSNEVARANANGQAPSDRTFSPCADSFGGDYRIEIEIAIGTALEPHSHSNVRASTLSISDRKSTSSTTATASERANNSALLIDDGPQGVVVHSRHSDLGLGIDPEPEPEPEPEAESEIAAEDEHIASLRADCTKRLRGNAASSDLSIDSVIAVVVAV